MNELEKINRLKSFKWESPTDRLETFMNKKYKAYTMFLKRALLKKDMNYFNQCWCAVPYTKRQCTKLIGVGQYPYEIKNDIMSAVFLEAEKLFEYKLKRTW